MVSANERILKYKQKFDPTVVGTRWTALKELAESKQTVRQAELKALRDDIRVILNEKGVGRLFTIPYLSLAMAIYGKHKPEEGLVMTQTEAEAIANYWIAQGCQKDVVNEILVYFGFSPLP